MGNMLTNRMLKLKTRPKGAVSSDNFELSEEQVPELKDGQILVKVLYLSLILLKEAG
jgi:NADPH-dependent curcumin reductase CurA